ncbi:transcription factor bHLH153 [Elaeis guineensis]|uniref:Transcription factor bHLH153 isoform X2 n=1 Tax=Elaeis guineensis var. tenera TaxID=51953 RepID=A0A8N4ET26_ELAGV|nr:transcription factor bHLH153 isoform X2 [Elaeis guineensis]
MMMMTEVAVQKRRSHDSFLLSNIAGADGGHSHSSSITTTTTTCNGLTAKRLKTSGGGGGAGMISTKEKKDKIGERVAKLQQLVSPFGKSDTASVLQEATGYIKFLHDQLQVLSGPYMQRTRPTGKIQEAEHCSLRSRGLCLMPISSALGIARSNGADLWAPAGSIRQP